MSCDHRHLQTPVRRQGRRQTCVGFAVSAAHEWHRGGRDELSPEDAMWAGHQAGGSPAREETSVKLALIGLSAHAHLLERAWPYGSPPWPGPRPATHDARNIRDLPAWRTLRNARKPTVAPDLEDGRPVILTLNLVYPAWYMDGDVVDVVPGAPWKGNHTVLAVGVTDDGVLVKNSWGAGWGDQGYALVTDRYLAQHGVCAHVLEADPT